MFIGNPLAIALGAATSSDPEDGEQARKQLIRAGEAMVDAGLAIVLNKAGTKQPLCTLTAAEAKRADQAAIDAAAATGDQNSHKRKHTCGLSHVITERKDATRILTRLARRERFNIGAHCGRSRVLVVDLDTARQLAEFRLRCGEQRPGLTVRSPGSRDSAGNWAHQDGGHVWFDVPDDIELPTSTGIYKDPAAGWVAMWGDHQVLVPPSVREEGPYTLVGSTHPLPDWLLDTIVLASREVEERREESKRRREERRKRGGASEIDEWAAHTSWSEILLPDGWVETTLIDRCGCPVWTAPGSHGSPKSATAHEPGCDTYSCEVGHGPLHVWTDNPSEAVDAAVRAYSKRTLTKLHVITWTQGAGNMSRTCDELGIERPGPTVIAGPLATWHDPAAPQPAAPLPVSPLPERTPDPAVADDRDDDDSALADEDDDLGPASIDEINDLSPRKVEEPSYDEQMIRREFQRIHWQEEARRRYQELHTDPLRILSLGEFLRAPRPDALIDKMLYRDSLACIYGPAGGGKSFLAIDLAMSVATGSFWCGTKLKAETVIYVMAEGQRVNGDRVEAWMARHGKTEENLGDRFYAVPDAVILTETGAAEFVKTVAQIQPAMVILDTKNAMMEGNEDKAEDNAYLRRVLDRIRKASDCCVVLIDHTGYEGTRRRGSSAGPAASDSEVRVTKNDSEKPSVITAEVTRDKAGEIGTTWAWRLMPEYPAAVLEAAQDVKLAVATPEWMTSDLMLPDVVESRARQDDKFGRAVKDLARFMQFETIPQNDRAQLGLALTQVTREMERTTAHKRTTIQRAWSWLKDVKLIAPAFEEPTEAQGRSGAHIWSGPIGGSAEPQRGGGQ